MPSAKKRSVILEPSEPTGYWCFFSKPMIWYSDVFLSSGRPNGDYTVEGRYQSDFRKGHLGLLRIGVDQRPREIRLERPKMVPGVYAIVEVLDTAHPLPPTNPDSLPEGSHFRGEKLRIRYRVLKNLLASPITVEQLKGLNPTDQRLVRPQQSHRSPYRLAPEVFRAIWELSGTSLPLEPPATQLQIVDLAGKLRRLEQRYRNAIPKVKERISKQIERTAIGELVKRLYGYKCSLCLVTGLQQLTFHTSGGKPYAEAHHVWPMSSRATGVLSPLNVIVLCTTHHRQMHYGRCTLTAETEAQFHFDIDGISRTIPKVKLA